MCAKNVTYVWQVSLALMFEIRSQISAIRWYLDVTDLRSGVHSGRSLLHKCSGRSTKAEKLQESVTGASLLQHWRRHLLR